MTYQEYLDTYGSMSKAAEARGISYSYFSVLLQKEHGLCQYSTCKEKVTGRRFCPVHTEKMRINSHNNYSRNLELQKERGLCQYSTCTEKVTGRRFCPVHTEKMRIYRRNDHSRNLGRDKKQSRAWEAAHREERKARKLEQRLEYYKRRNPKLKSRKKTDIQFRLACALRTRFRMAVKREYRAGSAVRDLGCSIADFKKYLEGKFLSGMTWDNYGRGRGKWCIDHVIPISKFDLTKADQVKLACHYINLQPLWWDDNLRKLDDIPTLTHRVIKVSKEIS